MGAKARSPQFRSIVVVREKGGHTRWPAEKRHRPQRSRDCRHYSLSHREKPLRRGKPMGLSRVLPEAKGYPSLEHSGSQPGQGRRSSSKVSPVLGRGSVPGVPGVPLATPQEKASPEVGSEKELGPREIPGPTATSDPAVLPGPSPRLQDAVLPGAPPRGRAPGPAAAEAGRPPDGASHTSLPCCAREWQTQRPHVHSASMPASRFGSPSLKKKKKSS